MKEKKILTGYSLGGRLAMHAIIERPTLWNAAIIISANPGLPKEEKFNRLSNDQIWSERFLSKEPWEQILKDWNNQSIFNNTIAPFQRLEMNCCRANLSKMITTWSLGMQDNLLSQLENLQLPILWITGSNDSKYTDIAKKLSFSHPFSEIWIAKNCGHRTPWECPDQFQQKINSWIATLS